MSVDDNKALVRQYYQEIDRLNVDALDDILIPDYDNHHPAPLPNLPPGREGTKATFGPFQTAFPDGRHIVEDQIAEGDKVVSRLTCVGTQRGELLGFPPTNKVITMAAIAIHRVADGRIVEHWGEMDSFGLMQQLGAIPVREVAPYTVGSWFRSSSATEATSAPEDAKAIARRHFAELWMGGNIAVADEIYAPTCVGHFAGNPDQHGYPESEKTVVRRDRAGIPDLRVEIDDQIADGNRVATRWTASGTHTGESEGRPPSGNPVHFTGIHVHRIRDGKIVEVWALDDLLGLLQQMGVAPRPQPVG